MDRTSIEKALAWMNPRAIRRVQGRRIKVYVASLDMNFYLLNPSGRRLFGPMMVILAYDGITSGWKKGARVWPRDVHLFEIGLMKLAQSQHTSADYNDGDLAAPAPHSV